MNNLRPQNYAIRADALHYQKQIDIIKDLVDCSCYGLSSKGKDALKFVILHMLRTGTPPEARKLQDIFKLRDSQFEYFTERWTQSGFYIY